MSPTRPYRVLVVCTGNTCRTPMAEALLAGIAGRRGLAVEVASAGTHAWNGAQANPLAVEAAARAGLDLATHSARLLTPELVRWADITLGMAMSHVYRARELDPASDVRLITEFAPDGARDDGIADPIGLGLDAYVAAFEEMRSCLEAFVATRFETSGN